MEMSRRIAIGTLSLAAALFSGTASSHGAPDPQHGGVVSTANDMAYELVATPAGALVYVTDHDNDFDTKNLVGKLTVLTGTQKTEVPLTPAGGNRLEATGVKLVKGSRAVATFEGSSRKTTTVRFVVK